MQLPPGCTIAHWPSAYKLLAAAPRTTLFTLFQAACDAWCHAERRAALAAARASAHAVQSMRVLANGGTWSPPSESEYSSDEHFSEYSSDDHFSERSDADDRSCLSESESSEHSS